jgi:hypothetical protein
VTTTLTHFILLLPTVFCCQNWNGSILDDISTVVNFAQTMTWKGNHPTVKLVTEIYQTGVRLTKQEMAEVENQIQRLPKLGKWFVEISYNSA